MSLRSEVVRIFNELLGDGKKITELPAATLPLTGDEFLEAVQGGQNVMVSANDLGGTTFTDGNGTIVNANSIDIGGTATDNITVDMADKSLSFSGTAAGKTNTISFSNAGGLSLVSTGAAQSAANVYVANGANITSVDFQPVGVTVLSPKFELTGGALTPSTNSSVVPKSYVDNFVKAIPLDAFTTSLLFDADDETFQTGGTHSFTLQASGNINGVGKMVKLNNPVSASFSSDFILMEGSNATVSATKLNIIVMLFQDNYDGVGTNKVIYKIIQQTSV